VLFVGLDVDAAGSEVHGGGRAGDGEVGALQPAAAAQGVCQGCGACVGAAVDRSVEQFGLVAGDGRDRDAEVLGCRVALPGALSDLKDPRQVDVQFHQAAALPPAERGARWCQKAAATLGSADPAGHAHSRRLGWRR
jgi:hypothetical protein